MGCTVLDATSAGRRYGRICPRVFALCRGHGAAARPSFFLDILLTICYTVCMTTEKTILTKLAESPNSLAVELGATPAQMNKLFKEGRIYKAGKRQTGIQGRPPIEWAIKDENSDVMLGEVEFNVSNAPKLPDASHVKPYANREEPRMLEFIEKVFAGDYGPRESDDFKILLKRYKDIIRQIEKRSAGRRAV